MEGVGAWATIGWGERRATGGSTVGVWLGVRTKAFETETSGFCYKMAKSGKFGLLRVFLPVFLLFGCKKYEADDSCFTFLDFMVDFRLVFNRIFVIYTPKNQE